MTDEEAWGFWADRWGRYLAAVDRHELIEAE